MDIPKNKKDGQPKPTVRDAAYAIFEYPPDTQPTCPLTTIACQPFSAVAIHSKIAPSFTEVMRLYLVSLPQRTFTLPPSETMTTVVPTVAGPSGADCSGVSGLSLIHI